MRLEPGRGEEIRRQHEVLQCLLCSRSCGPHQPANRRSLRAHFVTHAVLSAFYTCCKSLWPQIHSHPLPSVESQFPPNCAFLSNCVCFFLSQHILNEFPPGLRAHLHALCELFQCSGAGCHRFCRLHTKYSPVTL